MAFQPDPNLIAQLALCDALRDALDTANALDGRHAVQHGTKATKGTYGAIDDALHRAIEVTLENDGVSHAKAVRNARRLVDESISNGESISYCFDLMQRHVIPSF